MGVVGAAEVALLESVAVALEGADLGVVEEALNHGGGVVTVTSRMLVRAFGSPIRSAPCEGRSPSQ
jgi:hypothetical protein